MESKTRTTTIFRMMMPLKTNKMEPKRITSSFRDPSGYVFTDDGKIKRVINPIYFEQYKALTNSGFFNILFEKKSLIRHHEISNDANRIIIEHQKIAFITYPYEWSFLQYKHAALLTLKIQKQCLQNNFTLKDASAFNITFFEGKPIFIDTLSFDFYPENTPWRAYKQFVMHFLGPLVLCYYYGFEHLKSLAHQIDGIPLETLSKQLPLKSYLSPTLLTNIHLLAKYDAKHSETASTPKTKNSLSKASQIKLLDSLYDYIKNLNIDQKTEWNDYYNQINYEDAAFVNKKNLTLKWFESIKGKTVLDLGGNEGTFSRVLKEFADLIIVADIDANAVEQNYRQVLQLKEKEIIPVVIDFLNPPANYGFNNEERFSFLDRIIAFKPDGCLALAVIHHLTLSGNVPFGLSAKFFSQLSPNLLIEFPTREDSWVTFLINSKREFRNHFDFYNEENFEDDYSEYFEIIKKEPIASSARILYTMKARTTSI